MQSNIDLVRAHKEQCEERTHFQGLFIKNCQPFIFYWNKTKAEEKLELMCLAHSGKKLEVLGFKINLKDSTVIVPQKFVILCIFN